ncbi:hypothetical protein [Prochlorococcus sp. MIT 1341]|uniref:hypothetical protein n=1 Tax=Prochlorococcus sp. MIT 1341 TaxID=3096221 RepID=UPI002A75DC5B|nr:hypothetical protein [Prochlorococcus sp. MIT 1341]
MIIKSNRWVILEHLEDPNDPIGRHFDLLLEDGTSCRSWRLKTLPSKESQYVQCTLLPSHNLKWLDIDESVVSGGRGKAKRFLTGIYKGFLPNDRSKPLRIHLEGKEWQGFLEIDKIISRLSTTTQGLP